MPWLILVLDACVDTSEMMQMTNPHPDGNTETRWSPGEGPTRESGVR